MSIQGPTCDSIETRNKSFCNECQMLVTTRREERDGKVYLVKDCPACGNTETLISSHPERHFGKRALDIDHEYHGCNVQCLNCPHDRAPKYAFVVVTSRCNQNCPMCADNVPGLGFKFEPPMEYFKKIFDRLAQYDPKPTVALFGGEPTIREDILDIIALSRSYGFETRVLTNGLRMADEDFCRALLQSRAHILMSYDGANPETYRQMRGTDKVLTLKQQAIANIRKVGKGKVSYVSCLQWGLNDNELPELLEFCRSQSGYIRDIYLMPLTPVWDPGEFDYQPDRVGTEDIEVLVDQAFPDDKVEFLPLGFVSNFLTIADYLGKDALPFRGGHPNCESIYILISDGEKYRPMGHFLRPSVPEMGARMAKLEAKFAAREKRWKGSWLFPRFLRRFFGILRVMLCVMPRVRWSRIFKGKGLGKLWHAFVLPFAMIFGKKSHDAVVKHTNIQDRLLVILLPLEDNAVLETERLERCPSLQAYYDPRTDEVSYVPVCSWRMHNKKILSELADYYEAQEAERAPA